MHLYLTHLKCYLNLCINIFILNSFVHKLEMVLIVFSCIFKFFLIWLCWVFIFSSCGGSRGDSWVAAWGSHFGGSSRGSWALGTVSIVVTHRHMDLSGLVEPACCRQFFTYRATMEALHHLILKNFWDKFWPLPSSPSISYQLSSSVEFSLISLTFSLFIFIF